MKTSAGFSEMASLTESAMKRLEFEFARNEGKQTVEFDVSRPAPFLVRITHLGEAEYPSAVFGLVLPGRQSESTDFHIVFAEEAKLAREHSAVLVRDILASLKKPPWKGLGFVESMTAKAMWLRAAKGLD